MEGCRGWLELRTPHFAMQRRQAAAGPVHWRQLACSYTILPWRYAIWSLAWMGSKGGATRTPCPVTSQPGGTKKVIRDRRAVRVLPEGGPCPQSLPSEDAHSDPLHGWTLTANARCSQAMTAAISSDLVAHRRPVVGGSWAHPASATRVATLQSAIYLPFAVPQAHPPSTDL